jgi:hypothetical protein
MDIYQINLIFVPPLCAGVGFFFKHLFDKYNQAKHALKEAKLKIIECKLKNFYFPVYTNLLIENAIWDRFIKFYKSPHAPANADEIMIELDKEILKIHMETKNIINDYLVEINPTPELLNLLIQYQEHVTIFNILRKIDTDAKKIDDFMFPSKFNCIYPNDLLHCIVEELNVLLNEKQEITTIKEKTIFRYNSNNHDNEITHETKNESNQDETEPENKKSPTPPLPNIINSSFFGSTSNDVEMGTETQPKNNPLPLQYSYSHTSSLSSSPMKQYRLKTITETRNRSMNTPTKTSLSPFSIKSISISIPSNEETKNEPQDPNISFRRNDNGLQNSGNSSSSSSSSSKTSSSNSLYSTKTTHPPTNHFTTSS